MNRKPISILTIFMSTLLVLGLYGTPYAGATDVELGDAQIEDLVRRSHQYVAMYNVKNKFAFKQGGWNTLVADTTLKDHTMREIARPNNDTLYISRMLDLRKDPVILEMPAIDSKYVSLTITAYDHYVNNPMATRLGDFRKPEKMLIYSAAQRGTRANPSRGWIGSSRPSATSSPPSSASCPMATTPTGSSASSSK